MAETNNMVFEDRFSVDVGSSRVHDEDDKLK